MGKILRITVFIAVLVFFSFSFSAASFANDTTHTITIVNNSCTPLKPDPAPHMVTYSTCSSCLPPGDYCGQVNLNPPYTIAAHSSAVMYMTGPAGCRISEWHSSWDVPGKAGAIQCTVNPDNICNSIYKNYICTITQANVDAASAGRHVQALAH